MMEQLIETTQKNIEAMTACTQLCVESTKSTLEENVNFTNRLLQETASTWQEAMTSNADPKEKFEEISDYAKYCVEKTANQARESAEKNLQTAQKIGTTLSKRLSDSIEEIRSAA